LQKACFTTNCDKYSLTRNLLCTDNDFTSLLFDFLNKISVQLQELASMILWTPWKSRNSKPWERTDTPPESIVLRAKNSLKEWIHMQKPRQPSQGTHQEVLWEKPPPLMVKCNVDCALFNNNTITGLGICFRDSSGALLLGFSKHSYFNSTPPEVESLGLFEAINIAINCHM